MDLLALVDRSIFRILLLILLGVVEKSRLESCIQLDDPVTCPLNSNYLSFWVYNSDIENNPYKLTSDNIKDAPFYPNTPIIFMSHGYTGNKDYSPNMEIRPHYMKNTNYTIVSIDWGTLALEGCYVQAVHNVQYIGKCFAYMVDKILETRKDLECEYFRFVGLSLGAHVVGNAGRNVKTCKIPRITALDAASPLFEVPPMYAKNKIRKEDGAFVDGYHTNAGVKGELEQYGHFDVYINGGVVQPGCGTNTSCSHSRSADYFGWSVQKNMLFWGYKCESNIDCLFGTCKAPNDNPPILIGEYIKYGTNGVYAASTTDKAPFLLTSGTG